jgi:4-alpha-glucanotransferase
VDADHPPQSFTRDLHEKLLRALFESNSWIAVVMITDVFGRSERFNLPGVAGDVNWTQRLHAPVAGLHESEMVPRVKELLKETGRA